MTDGITTRPRRTKVERTLLLNIVIGECSSILKLLASKDKALLIGWDTLLVLYLRFHIVNGIRGLHFQRDRLAGESLDKDLHASTETED